MDLPEAFSSLGIALGLGLLVGLQRESAGQGPAGIRTFPLAALFGAAAALLVETLGGFVVGAGLLATGALVVTLSALRGREARGAWATSGLALLLMYVVGALAVLGPWELAAALGGTSFVLLHEKSRLHALAGRLGEKDGRAIAQLVLVTLIVLPVLPDRDMGPWDVWNPRGLWLLVALVSGLSLVAYLAQKALGSRGGVAVTGLLGGLVSSTATTVSVARRGRGGAQVEITALVIVVASIVVTVRQAVEIVAVDPAQLATFTPALLVGVVGLLPATLYGIHRLRHAAGVELPESENPAEIGSALVFALIFGVVLLAVAFASERLGEGGVYAVATISGLTNVDAITLSTARMAKGDHVDPGVAWRAVMLAFVANLAFKAVIAGMIAGRRVGVVTGRAFAPVAVLGALAWLLVP